MRILPSLLILFVAAMAAVFAAAPRAAACTCIARTPEEYMKGADLVFFARAHKERTEGKRQVQLLTVLHALKGRPGKAYTLSRPSDQLTTCDSHFLKGQVVLVFITGGRATVCEGNTDLKAMQLAHMGEYLKLGTPTHRAPDLGGAVAAITNALGPHLHERPVIPVTWKPLAPRRARAGKTTLEFVTNRLKHAVELKQAVQSGPVIFVEGRYGLEGYNFRVLLLRQDHGRGKGTFEVLATWRADARR